MFRSLAPHLAQTILGRKDGIAVSAGQAETSSRPPFRHSGFRQDTRSRCTPSSRILPSVIGGPARFLGLETIGRCALFAIEPVEELLEGLFSRPIGRGHGRKMDR
jgi:hypothetical protein